VDNGPEGSHTELTKNCQKQKKKKQPVKEKTGRNCCCSLCGGREAYIKNIPTRQAAEGGLLLFRKNKSEGASSPSETKIRGLENYTGS
jgi:hypothetical protein